MTRAYSNARAVRVNGLLSLRRSVRRGYPKEESIMTDPWAQTAPLTPQRPRGFSPGTVAILATATVLLAVAGLAIGWFVAGDGEPNAEPSSSPSVAVSV